MSGDARSSREISASLVYNERAKEMASPAAAGCRKQRYMRTTEQKILAVNATMAMEGMPLTDEDRARLRDIFDGKATADAIVQGLVKKHSQKKVLSYGRT
jgi:hypothetical protein